MFYIIIYIIFAILSQIITYKIVRNIDKKERKFLKQWEKDYIEAYKDLWQKAYFDKLAEEKKIKAYEKEAEKNKQDLKDKLNNVSVNNIYEEYHTIYEDKLNQAIARLKESEEKVND